MQKPEYTLEEVKSFAHITKVLRKKGLISKEEYEKCKDFEKFLFDEHVAEKFIGKLLEGTGIDRSEIGVSFFR